MFNGRYGRQQCYLNSMSAPVLGLNTIQGVRLSKDGYARQLDNWLPRGDFCETRKGHQSHATGAGSNIETLITWKQAAGKMLACSGGSIYNATTAGAVGSALASGYANARWQYQNFNGYVIAVNGANTPIQYNGSTISNSTMTGSGLTVSNLININSYKERLFFIEKDTLKFWYLPVKSITGTLTVFDLSYVARLGGELIAMATWSVDGGDGKDDLAVFLTSEGEAIVYQGSDPSSAADWALVGIYFIGRPIGRRCFVGYGSEMAVITEKGFLPITRVFQGKGNATEISLSGNIQNIVSRAIQDYGDVFGWQPIVYSKENVVILNQPTTTSTVYQYVMDANSNAWCRFTGLNAKCWAELSGTLYFANAGVVYKAFTGVSDNGAAITADARTSFSNFGNNNKKFFSQVRPVLKSNGQPDAYARLDIDYKEAGISITPNNGTTNNTPWGSPWGSPWSAGEQNYSYFNGVEGEGITAAVALRIKTNLFQTQWFATDVLMQRGNFA